jgi:hypothetical protein
MSSETERITNQVIERHDLEGAIENLERPGLHIVETRPLPANDERVTQSHQAEPAAPTIDRRSDYLTRILWWLLTRPRVVDTD